mmetsp:Transcript_30529/g.98686  ORF Transcript_30529/g.98686 Transcript_30529/m.98686 type:complete len:206 (+) Transcript_30529:694-1311(+)
MPATPPSHAAGELRKDRLCRMRLAGWARPFPLSRAPGEEIGSDEAVGLGHDGRHLRRLLEQGQRLHRLAGRLESRGTSDEQVRLMVLWGHAGSRRPLKHDVGPHGIFRRVLADGGARVKRLVPVHQRAAGDGLDGVHHRLRLSHALAVALNRAGALVPLQELRVPLPFAGVQVDEHRVQGAPVKARLYRSVYMRCKVPPRQVLVD